MTVTKAVAKDMPVEVNAIGNVQPVVAVAIRSQVTGRMLRVNFKEGDYVKKGALLFSLDSRPFVEAVKEAQAKGLLESAQMIGDPPPDEVDAIAAKNVCGH